MSRSHLGLIMKKMGLQIGVDTGSNLNKLIMPKPPSQLTFNEEKKKSEPKNIFSTHLETSEKLEKEDSQEAKPINSPKEEVPNIVEKLSSLSVD
jgi:hypothetical protein